MVLSPLFGVNYTENLEIHKVDSAENKSTSSYKSYCKLFLLSFKKTTTNSYISLDYPKHCLRTFWLKKSVLILSSTWAYTDPPKCCSQFSSNLTKWVLTGRLNQPFPLTLFLCVFKSLDVIYIMLPNTVSIKLQRIWRLLSPHCNRSLQSDRSCLPATSRKRSHASICFWFHGTCMQTCHGETSLWQWSPPRSHQEKNIHWLAIFKINKTLKFKVFCGLPLQ